jgi:flagellar biosynthesis protein FlhG
MIGQAERLYQLNGLLKAKVSAKNSAKIIAITSGKGGTGKSFVASNFAVDLANKGAKVLLVDLDINMGNQNVLFNISSKKTIYHYLTYNQNLDDIIYNYSNNLDIILGESGKVDHPKLDEERAILLVSDLKNLSKQYDVILIDTASGADSGAIFTMLKSDEIVLVATPEPTAVMDAYVVLKLLKSNGLNSNTNIIINKCITPKNAIEAFENLKKATNHFLKVEVNNLGSISFSADAIKSIQEQNPLLESNPESELSTQISRLSSKLRIPTIG